jgi:peptide/nickel transport system substrate-binding protein
VSQPGRRRLLAAAVVVTLAGAGAVALSRRDDSGPDPAPSASASASSAPSASPSAPPGPASLGSLFGERPDDARPGRRGGRAVVAVPAEATTLDPFAVGGDTPAARDLAPIWLPGLWRMDPTGTRSPWLAAGTPSVDAAGKRVSIALRPDAHWSDGSAITSADVAATWRYATGHDGPWRAAYDDVTAVETPSPARAVLVLRSARSLTWARLFTAPTGVLPASRLTALAGKPYDLKVTGGPFVRSGGTPGLETVWKRTPQAWPGSDPQLDELVTRVVPDFSTATALLKEGKVDTVAPYSSIDARRRLEAAGADEVVDEKAGGSITVLTFDTASGPTADPRVRQALARALDRRAFSDGLLRGGGLPAHDLVRAGAAGGGKHFADAPDLGAAKRLLDAAGWRTRSGGRPRAKGGQELTLVLATASPSDLDDVVVRGMQVQLRPLGVQIDLAGADAPLADRLARDGTADLAIARWDTDPVIPDLTRRLLGAAAAPDGANVSRWRDPQAATLLGRVESLADPRTALTQLLQRVAAQLPVLPLYVVHAVSAGRGVRPGLPVSGYGGPFASADRWSRTA